MLPYIGLVPLSTCPSVAAATFFPIFFKILDTPFNFILPGIVWIAELCFCSATNWDCLKLKWGQLFSCFSENCFSLPMLWTVEFKVDLKMMSFDLNDFLHCYRKSIYVWIETLVLFAAAVLEVKQKFSITGQPKVFWNLTFFLFGFLEVSWIVNWGRSSLRSCRWGS